MSNNRPAKTLPFAFWLEDAHEHSAMYIVDEDLRREQRLKVWIENTSEGGLYFQPLKPDAPLTEENSHFQLCFRRGVLADASLGHSKNKLLRDLSVETLASTKYKKQAFQTGSWKISPPHDVPGLPYISFFLGRVGKEQAAELAAGQRLSFTLINISAAPGHGTRATHVQLIPRNVFSRPELLADSRIGYSREQPVQVINHLGKEHIPLHTAFIGTNVVLNDGRDHGAGYALKLRITNISRHDPITFTPDSRIIFEFDYSDGDQAEALGESGNVGKIQFYLENDKIEAPDGIDMAVNPHWLLAHPNQLADRSIEPHEHWDITVKLDEFATVSPAGLTLLKIKYENVPGYWDGMLHAEVEKRPLLIQDDDAWVKLNTGVKKTFFTNSVELEHDSELFFRDQGQIRSYDDFHRIMFRRPENIMEFREYGKILFTPGAKNATPSPKVTMLANGHVGFGVSEPKNLIDLGSSAGKKLAIYQNTAGTDFYGLGISSDTLEIHAASSANDSPKMVVRSNGDVGIGRPTPGAKLDVNGKIKATSLDVNGTIEMGGNGRFNLHNDKNGLFAMNVSTSNGVAASFVNNSPWQNGGSFETMKIENKGGGWALLITKGDVTKPGNKEWDNPSDLRLKEDITNYPEGLNEINQLRPVWYRYNGKNGIPKDRYVGIIAQELQEIAPHMVTPYKGDDGETYLMANTSPLTYMLVNAVQELSQRVEELEKKVITAKNQPDA